MSPNIVTSVECPIGRVVACMMNHFRRTRRIRPLFSLNRCVNRSQHAIQETRTKMREKENRNEEDLLVEMAMSYTRTSTTLHLPLHNSTKMKMVSIAANAKRPLVAIALRSHSIPIQSVARNRIYSIESIHYHVLLSVVCTHWFHSYTSIQSLHSPMNWCMC